MDTDCNWPMFFDQYNHPSSILDRLQTEYLIDQAVTTNSSPGHLNPEQWTIYDTVVDQYTRELAVDQPEPSQLLL